MVKDDDGIDETIKRILDRTGKEVFPPNYYDIEPIDGHSIFSITSRFFHFLSIY